jgi:SAM-dependent methyltransferase
MPVFTPAQRLRLQEWLTETGELYVDHYRPHSGGPSDNYFIDSVEDLEALITNEKWPELVVTIFRRLQFPIRGVADEALLARALQEIPDHKEIAVKNLAERYPSPCGCWGGGNSHAELRGDFSEIIGERVGIGLEPEEIYEGIWDYTKRSYWASHDEVMVIERKRPPSLYETISEGFVKTRLADALIIEKLAALLDLPPNSTILDIYAGTDKYSRALVAHGYRLLALETNESERTQPGPPEHIRYLQISDGSIPVAGNSADGAIIILALHRLPDYSDTFREIIRVVGHGPIILLIFNHRAFEQYWLADYFPQFGHAYSGVAGLSDLVAELNRVTARKVAVLDFPLPSNRLEEFGAARLAHPEDYLDPAILAGISDFAWMEPAEIEHGLKRLQDDLSSGQWDAKYGALRTQPSYDVGYHFVVISPTTVK